MYHHKIILTPRQEAWLIKHFKHTKNAEIAERLGCSETAVHRFARQLGLKKTPQFRRKVQAEVAAAAKASHLRNGTYPPKGYIIPRSEEFRFRKGETPVERLGEERNAERIRKSVEARAKTFRYEHARYIFGVPRKTKLRVAQQPRDRICQRYYLKKHGYIIDDKNFIAYWTPETVRALKLEAAPRKYYRFQPYQECKDTL